MIVITIAVTNDGLNDHFEVMVQRPHFLSANNATPPCARHVSHKNADISRSTDDELSKSIVRRTDRNRSSERDLFSTDLPRELASW